MTKDTAKETIANNIRRIIEKSGMTQEQVADRLGVSATTVVNWVMGHKTPRMDKIDALCDLFKVSRESLLTGEKVKSTRIRVYGSIPAGIPIEAIEDIEDWEEIPSEWTAGEKQYIALKVTGDSMYPKYLEGDTVIILLQEDCESGDDAAVYVNGYDATLKTVIKNPDCSITLKPINPNYAPKTYKEDVRILGIIKELRRKI